MADEPLTYFSVALMLKEERIQMEKITKYLDEMPVDKLLTIWRSCATTKKGVSAKDDKAVAERLTETLSVFDIKVTPENWKDYREAKGLKLTEDSKPSLGADHLFTARDHVKTSMAFDVEEYPNSAFPLVKKIHIWSDRIGGDLLTFIPQEILRDQNLPEEVYGKFTVAELRFLCNALREMVYSMHPINDWWKSFEWEVIQKNFVKENRVGWVPVEAH